MIPISDNPPPGVIDRRDGSTKGENGITTTKCLYASDQIAGSAEYVANYAKVAMAAKDACQVATCPLFLHEGCWANWYPPKKAINLEKCPYYRHRHETGTWREAKGARRSV
ncbi:MAG: hypothetical protein JEZ11_17840 [Desulfobacterales bacterium]|nr:hypothetical protein [Desulfobacterales bacterium]